MKKIFYIIIPIFICSISVAQSVPNYEVYKGDTINVIDGNNLKQGFWKIFGRMKRVPNYEPDQVIEEGSYKDSRKQGFWTKFFPSGKTKSEIEYKNSRPNGSYKTYYENGQIEEEGNWKSNRNTGKFVRHHENGQVAQEFEFSTTGKRDGKQIYRNEEGIIIIDADIKNGKEEKVVEYYDDGSLKAEKNYVDGKLDVANTKVYDEPKNLVKKKDDEGVKKVVTITKEEHSNDGKKWDGNGLKKMYNKNAQLSKDGIFKDHRLMDGKLYVYDVNGILIRIELFKRGRMIGEAPLPKD